MLLLLTIFNSIFQNKIDGLVSSTLTVLILLYAVILLLCLALIFLSNNTIFSVFSLIVVFFTSSLLLLLLDYEYLAIVLTAVYVGAISVFFIFVLMTINLRFEDTVEYDDEISKDKNFSFIMLFYFSSIFQVFFYFDNWRRDIYQSFVDYYLTLKYFALKSKLLGIHWTNSIQAKVVHSEVCQNQFGVLTWYNKSNAVSFDCNADLYEKYVEYNDVSKLALDLFNGSSLFFVIITFMLLLTMIASLGFAVRSR